MSRSSVKRKAARTTRADQAVSADADGIGTSNHRPREQIHEMEEQYRGIFEASTNGLAIVDMEGDIVAANPAFCQLHGYRYDEMIGLHATALVHPGHHHLIAQGIEAIGKGAAFQEPVMGLRKDGSIFYTEVTGTRLTYKGKPHILGVARDITEQVEAEEQLREREAQYRSIFESTTDGLVILDLDGVIVEANPAYCELLGYPYEELIGLPVMTVTHPDYRSQLAGSLQTVTGGQIVRDRLVVLRKDGTPVYLEGGGTSFLYNGTPHVLGVVRDVTREVQAEEQLREREAQYRSIFEATSDGLIVNDFETGLVVEVNPAFCAMNGYTRDELIGMHPTAFIHPDSHHLFGAYMQTVQEGRSFQAPAFNLRKDGTPFPVEVHGALFTYQGKPHILGVVRDTTERIQAEEQVRQKEAQYRSIFEATTDGLAILDTEGRFVEVNPAYCKLTGYSLDELVGMHTAALIHPDYHHLIAEGMQAISEGRDVWVRSVLVRKDGTLLQIEGGGTQFTYKGTPHFLGMARDITERLQAEEQLREREAQYRSVFEAATDGLVIQDFEGHIVEINPAYCRMLGYTRDELIGKHISILIPPEHYHLIAESMQSIGAGDTPQARVVVLRKDGTQLHVDGHGVAFQLNGKPHILGVARDISERVRAEDQLREKEEQYRSIFEATTDGLGVLDMEGYIVEVNPAYCQMYGYSRDEVIGLHALALMHPDYHHLLAEGMQSIEMGNPVQVRSISVRKDGTLFYVDGRGTTFLFNGKPHILGVSRDITEQVRAEEQLQEREEQYRSIFESSADGLGIYDQGGFLVEANPALCQMLGYTHDELIGLHAGVTVHPKYHHVIAEGLERVNRDVPFRREIVLLRKDGTSFPADAGATTFMYKGTPHELVVLRDVSERVEAEKQIREREAEYRGIFEATNDGMVIADMDGYIVEANDAQCKMFGYTRDELIGLHTTELAHPDYRHVIAESLEAERAGRTYQALAKGLHKDGTTFYADGRGTSFMYRGKLHALGIVQDVTERVRAYELLEQRVEERTRELSTLLHVSHTVSSTLELRPLLDLILDQLMQVVEYTGATITLIDGDEFEVVAQRGPVNIAGVRFPLDAIDYLWEPLERGGPLIVDDVRADTPVAIEYRRRLAALPTTVSTSLTHVRSWMVVPLRMGERLVGHLHLDHAEPNAFTPHHTELAMALAQQAAIAIENARLYEQATERTRELSTLLEVSHNVSSTLELKPLLDLILDQIAGVVEYAGASISLIDGDESEIVAFRGRGSADVAVGLRIPVEHMDPGPESWGSRPLIIDDVRADTPEAIAYRRNESKLLDSSFSYVRSWMAVPLIVNERLVGVLTLNGAEPGLYTPHHTELVLGIASQAAIAIENARLYEQTVQRTSELSALLDVSHNVASTLELKPLLGLILDQLNLVADNDGITLLEVRGDEFVVLLRRVPGHEDQEFPRSYSTQSHGPIWDKLRRGEVVIIGNVRGDDPLAHAYRKTVGDFLNTSLSFEHSFMAVPLMLKDRIIGLLGLSSARCDHYTPHHGEVALAIAQQAAIAIENARLYEQAQEVAALEERQRLARELHDSVSQALFGIGLGARTARALLERDVEQAAQSIDYVHSLAQSGMAEMRALIFELRPESLEAEGLVQALKKQADAASARHEIPISPTLCDEPDIPLPVKEALYRIAQEALHNTVKHARPRSVDVSLERNQREVVLEIRDDGVGFDTGGSFPGHLGLHSMRERAERVGGTVEVESRIGEGTRVRVRVPTC